MKLEFDNSRHLIGSLSSVVDELVHFSLTLPNLILDLRPSASQCMVQIESIFRSHEMIHSCLRSKVRELEEDKELEDRHEAEKSEYLCQLQMLQRENSSLSSCSLAKEKESIRKDLEKTKLKLKDMEFKLKNAVQEKTKLEGEKSCAERELKRLQIQKAMLERDMSKRESIIGRRRDSTIDRSSNVFDQKRTKGSTALAELEEEYKKLEVVAFEMETVIGALEDQLAIANGEKDAATSRAETLASDLQALSDELYSSNSELSTLKEEVSSLVSFS
ncbi:UNVERIFIED_CONTAM: Kinesin-like protein KIN-7O [Sesamum radiatum]|uniref:Kinesin-like protein KIN-7O n=1 Tax=Sesamum radiatum TaxID=300843 RepID=A0AAW2TJ45_SESRA